MFKSIHPVLQLIFDAGLATVLVAVGAIFAGGLQSAVTPTHGWMYGVWFVIGLIPGVLYMRYRGAVEFDRWDIVAFSPMPLVLGIAHEVDSPYDIVVCVLLMQVCLWIRGFLPDAICKKSTAQSTSLPSNE